MEGRREKGEGKREEQQSSRAIEPGVLVESETIANAICGNSIMKVLIVQIVRVVQIVKTKVSEYKKRHKIKKIYFFNLMSFIFYLLSFILYLISYKLIAVVFALIWAINLNADVISLSRSEFCKLNANLGKMQSSNFFV